MIKHYLVIFRGDRIDKIIESERFLELDLVFKGLITVKNKEGAVTKLLKNGIFKDKELTFYFHLEDTTTLTMVGE